MAFRRIRSDQHDSQADLLRKQLNHLSVGLGLYGADRYTSGTHPGGEWLILHAFIDSTVTFIRDGVTEAAVALKAGDRVYGKITSVTVTSGDVELYRSPA